MGDFIQSIFGGGGSSPPPLPAYTPPPTKDNSAAELEAANAKQRALSSKSKGRASTLGSQGASGVTSAATTQKTTLGG